MTVREVISNKLASVSIRDLLLVEAVAAHSSFRLAAAAMDISTSGLSHQIRKVEEILGQAIFERGNRVSPTTYGNKVLDVIASVLANITQLEDLRNDSPIPFGPTLRVGVISSLSPNDLLHIIKKCQQESSQTKVEVISGKHHGLLRRLQEREIDFLITASTEVPDGFVYAKLFHESFVLLYRSDLEKPLLDPVTPSALSLLPFSEDDFIPEKITKGLEPMLNSALTRTYGLGITHRLALVLAGYGFALMPKRWIESLSLPDNTSIIELPSALSEKRTITCVWRESFAIGAEIVKSLSYDSSHQQAKS